MLTLIRASKSRRSGTWSDDDYDVIEDGKVIGRIVWTHAAPTQRRWLWTITVRLPQAAADKGTETTREDAMAAFKRSWERKDQAGPGPS